MKKISIFIAVILFIGTFASCNKNDAGVSNTQPTENYSYTENNKTDYTNTENNTVTPSQKETTKPSDVSVEDVTSSQVSEQTRETTENKVVTYISENPDNEYICRVAEKYGSDKANLIAFIKTNSSTPGATVIEFSGKRDSRGNLIVTAEELRYVYDVSDSGTIKRASADGKNNDGYSKLVAKTVITLAEKYIIPNIDEMRSKRRYEDYFPN